MDRAARATKVTAMQTDVVALRPLGDNEALEWLREHSDLKVTVADLARRWSWSRQKVSRRLDAWAGAGLITRERGAKGTLVILAEPLPPAAPQPTADEQPSIEPAPAVDAAPLAPASAPAPRRVTRHAVVNAIALLAALALAGVSAYFSVTGFASIFPAAVVSVMVMGAALEGGKLVAAAWLRAHWRTAPRSLRAILVVMVAALMAINAVGVFGYLSRAHLDQLARTELGIAGQSSDLEARLGLQTQIVADLDRRIGQIDGAIEESTRRGRATSAMAIADHQQRARSELAAARLREARTLAELHGQKARLEAQRRHLAAEVGPIRYLAQLIGGTDADLERAVRLLTLAIVLVLDPLAVVLLLASGSGSRREEVDGHPIPAAAHATA
jgi:hypothetical protein